MAVGANRNSSDTVVQRLLTALEQVCQRVDGNDEDENFLRQLLQSRSLQALVYVHNRVTSHEGKNPTCQNSSEVANEVVDFLDQLDTEDSQELQLLLADEHIKALLEAHDIISKKDYIPTLPDVLHDGEDDEETIKIVQLVKSNEPLGATIKFNESSGMIVIARIMHGGAADRSGLIHVGDEVYEVNGVSVRGKAPNDVVNILKECGTDGAITFKLAPADDGFPSRESRVRMRAHFSYDPVNDLQIPCHEAGLAFSKGDILHIVNQDDPCWWQARKEGERNCRAGLIPGRQLQERRLASMRDLTHDRASPVFTTCPSPKPLKPRKVKKVMYDIKENDDFDREELATYEEVAKLYPRLGLHRPLVLIGPPGVGRNELKSRLLAIDPDLFQTTIPHTSRPKKPWEVEGKEYYFVSRQLMEEEIQTGRFVEYGEYMGNLYGTSIETVRSKVNAGYACVMTPHPQALKKLRTAELKPYTIFIKPPPLPVLRETREMANAKSTFAENASREFTEEEFHEIIYIGHKLEYLYGHTFDTSIVNDNLSRAFQELLTVVRSVQIEAHWVPASWVATC